MNIKKLNEQLKKILNELSDNSISTWIIRRKSDGKVFNFTKAELVDFYNKNYNNYEKIRKNISDFELAGIIYEGETENLELLNDNVPGWERDNDSEIFSQQSEEIPLCTDDNVRDTEYLIKIDIADANISDFESERDWRRFKKLDGKYIVSSGNYSFMDMINDGDLDEVVMLSASTPEKAMEKYWKNYIDNVGEELAVDFWNQFEQGGLTYWEDTEEAQQFRDIGARILK